MKKQTLIRTAATPVFFLLMIATGISWWLGVGSNVAHTTMVVITIAFVKCFLIGLFFMEILHAPKALLLVFTAWCTVGWAGVLGIYLLG